MVLQFLIVTFDVQPRFFFLNTYELRPTCNWTKIHCKVHFFHYATCFGPNRQSSSSVKIQKCTNTIIFYIFLYKTWLWPVKVETCSILKTKYFFCSVFEVLSFLCLQVLCLGIFSLSLSQIIKGLRRKQPTKCNNFFVY